MHNIPQKELEFISKELKSHLQQNSNITDQQFDNIFSYFVAKKIKKHQFLVQENSLVLYEYFVVKGLLKSSFINHEGKEYIMEFSKEHHWISDYQAYFNQTNATLNIDALEDSILLCITLENRKKICIEVRALEDFFLSKMNEEYIKLQQRILSLLNDTPKVQLEKLTHNCPDLLQRVSKTKIASYLGVARETLSRIS